MSVVQQNCNSAAASASPSKAASTAVSRDIRRRTGSTNAIFNSPSPDATSSATPIAYDDEELDALLDQLDDDSLARQDSGSVNPNSRRRKRRLQRRQLDAALLTNRTSIVRPRRSWNILRAGTLRRRSSRLLDTALDKFLSAESAGAVMNIRKILGKLEEDHGIVDIVSMHSPREILLSGLALSRLQSAAVVAEERGCISGSTEKNDEGRGRLGWFLGIGRGTSRVGGVSHVVHNEGGDKNDTNSSCSSPSLDRDLLEMIAHYARFAVSAYGWKGRLALSGRLHLGDVRALEARTGIHRSDIIDANWRSRTHRPAYFIARDVQRKKIILSVRGTWSPRDVLTDLCAAAEDYDIFNRTGLVSSSLESATFLQRTRQRGKKQSRGEERSPRAHQGMVESAKEIARATRDAIKNELEWNSEYSLVIVGHSLGAGISSVLGSMWKETFRGLTVLAYGCPCVGPLDAEPTNNNDIISIVAEGDPFSCLSIGHLADVSAALSRLCDNTEMRTDILRRSRGAANKMSDNDLRWCHDALKWLRQECMTQEKLYPPGRILYMRGSNSIFRGKGKNIELVEVPTNSFRELKLHARMFDLSRHIPTRYESALEKIWRQTTV